MNTALQLAFRSDPNLPPHDASSKAVCPACTSDKLVVMDYPDTRQWFFVNMTVLGCCNCGLAWVARPPRALDWYYQHLYSLEKKREIRRSAEEFFADDVCLRAAGISRSHRHASILAERGAVDAVVDVGCGYGITLWQLDARLKIGVEIDPNMHPYLQRNGVRIESRMADIPDCTADVVISSHNLEHFPISRVPEILGEMRRLLKPGGQLLLEVPNASLLTLNLEKVRHAPHLCFFSAQSLLSIVEAAELRDVRISGQGKGARPLRRKLWYRPTSSVDVRNGALLILATR